MMNDDNNELAAVEAIANLSGNDGRPWHEYLPNELQDYSKAEHTAKSGRALDRYKSRPLGQFKTLLAENPVVATEGTFSQVTNKQGQLSWVVRPISNLCEGFQRGELMCLNEFLPLGTAVKAYFDVDTVMNRDYTEEQMYRAYDLTARLVIGDLSRHCGFSSDRDDWIILACPYIGHEEVNRARKLSMHFIYRRWKFASHVLLGKWIRQNVPVEVIQKLHIDMAVYGRTQNMRGLGMSKYVQTRGAAGVVKHFPFLMFNPPVNHQDITYALYSESLIQKTDGLHEIHVDGQSQEMAVLRAEIAGEIGNAAGGNALIAGVLAILKAEGKDDRRNQHVQAFAIDQSPAFETNSHKVKVTCKLEGYEGFRGCKHYGEIELGIFVEANCFKLYCGHCSEDLEYGLTNEVEHFVELCRMFHFLEQHGFSRPDFPFEGTSNAVGFFAVSEEEFWLARKREAKENAPNCGCFWCAGNMIVPKRVDGTKICVPMHINGTNPTVFSRELFYWIQKRYANLSDELERPDYSKMMEIYLNCMICALGSEYYVRGAKLKAYNQTQMKELLGNLMILTWKLSKKKRKNDPDEYEIHKTPVFDLWRKDIARRNFEGIRSHGLKFGRGSQLNVMAPIELDVNECIQIYDGLEMAEKECLRQAYILLMKMFVHKETDPEIRRQALHYLYRWTHLTLFRFSEPKKMSVFIVSRESGGQGKSTFGELIGSFLGISSDYYKSHDGNTFANDKFNGFCNGLNVLNEVKFKNDAQAQDLKSKVMADTVSIRPIFKESKMVIDRMTFWMTSNAFQKELAQPGMDRRMIVLEIDSIETIDSLGIIRYECEYCDHDCPHSIQSHTDLMSFYKEVLAEEDDEAEVDFRKAYVGMLYRFFEAEKQCYPDMWKRPKGSFCPQTEAGAVMRVRTLSQVERFWTDCMARGYHFNMTSTPTNQKCQIFFTEGMKNRFEQEKVDHRKGWERIVPEKTLYQTFMWWCEEVGEPKINLRRFVEDTNLFYRTKVQMRGGGIVNSLKQCYCMEWKRENSETYKWGPTTNPECQERCLDLGPEPWILGKRVAPRFNNENLSRKKRMLLSRSSSNLNMDRRSNSSSLSDCDSDDGFGGGYAFGNSNTFYPIDSQNPYDDDHPRYLHLADDDEDAQDPYKAVVRTRGRGNSVDEEEENDVNVREKKKIKHPFIVEVEEDEDELSGSLSLEPME